MAYWQPFEEWIDFRYLDGGSAALQQCYTIAYRITDEPDEWSLRFNAFKRKEEDAIRRAARLAQYAVPPLLQKLGIDRSDALFVPAHDAYSLAAPRATSRETRT